MMQPRGYFAAFQGAKGAMILQDDRARLHLFDSDGWCMADSGEKLAMEFPDRLRAALDGPPRPSRGLSHHLIKDAKGRIWWAGWRWQQSQSDSWGVIDDTGSIQADAAILKNGPRAEYPLAVLSPIGDGTKMLAVDEACVGCVVDLENGQIVSAQPSPVEVGDATNHWRPNVLYDHSGHVWVMTSRRSEHTAFVGHGGRRESAEHVPGSNRSSGRGGIDHSAELEIQGRITRVACFPP